MARRESTTSAAEPRRVVYTALIGQYEELNEQLIADASSMDFICFTDDPDITSETWTIKRIEPRFPLDAIRSARYLKVKGPDLLPEYDESLWIDNSVLLRVAPETILDSWLASTDIALPRHSYRTSVLGEFDAIATQGYDDPARVYEQLIHYSAIRPKVLKQVPYWTALLARRHGPKVREAMDLWFDQILRYSRRDQLSVNYVFDAVGAEVTAVDIDNWESPWHRWPQLTERKWAVTQDRLANALRVPQADIGKLENMVLQLRKELDALTQDNQSVRGVIDAYEDSASWKATAPLRSMSRFFRRG